MVQEHPVGQGLLFVEDPRSYSGTPHSLRFLSTSDQPVAETSTKQHTTVSNRQIFIHPVGF